MHELFHDARHSRQHLERRRQIVGSNRIPRRTQLVQCELHPQFAGLVLNDEQQLVRIGRAGMLRVQDRVEREVVAVADVARRCSCHGLSRLEFGTLPLVAG